MKLTTIWTFPGLPLRERLTRTRDLTYNNIANRLPNRLTYWVLITQGAAYSQRHPKQEVPATRYLDVLRDHPHNP